MYAFYIQQQICVHLLHLRTLAAAGACTAFYVCQQQVLVPLSMYGMLKTVVALQ
jgi:hypothetical protein